MGSPESTFNSPFGFVLNTDALKTYIGIILKMQRVQCDNDFFLLRYHHKYHAARSHYNVIDYKSYRFTRLVSSCAYFSTSVRISF